MDIVIGAAFGDEGKGAITHYLASKYGHDAIVVRFNGGAQAGHTVVANDKRHVFRHIGSGTFSGAATYLSRFFVSNPILFLEEYKELENLGFYPQVFVDPESVVTTPYDMMINQIIEDSRGKRRHGSCGVGFSETIERNQYPQFALTVADLANRQKLLGIMRLIREQWVPQRLKEMEITSLANNWKTYIESEDVFEFYLDNISSFLDAVTVKHLDLLTLNQHIIFEGAQGLMLDQNSSWFPHVTRSNTGLKNVLKLVGSDCRQQLNVTYITRCYFTRHGAGPLPNEIQDKPYKKITDKTNTKNNYQGSLRYAWFNLDLLKSFIQNDLKCVPNNYQLSCRLAVTCLDQLDERVTYIVKKRLQQASSVMFLQAIAHELNLSELICSYADHAEGIRVKT